MKLYFFLIEFNVLDALHVRLTFLKPDGTDVSFEDLLVSGEPYYRRKTLLVVGEM